MFMRKNGKLFLLTTALTMLTYTAAAQYVTAQNIYSYAKNADYNALSALRTYINMPDGNGNTAYCLALANGDTKTMQVLQNAGADSNVSCVNKIKSARPKEQFMTETSMFGIGAAGWTAIGVLGVAGIITALATDRKSSGDDGGETTDVIGAKLADGQTFNQTLSVENSGAGNVYGIVFEGGGNNAANTTDQTGTAQVTVDNKQKGTAYGLYSTSAKTVINASSIYDTSSTATGTVNIKNQSGDVYAVKAKEANNAIASSGTAIGNINIENVASVGKTYGISADSAYNAASINSSGAIGNIYISGKSSGDIYAISAKTAYNAYAALGGNATGNIYIDTEGESKIYGMYGNTLINADIPTNDIASATGKITVVSREKSTAHGMYATDEGAEKDANILASNVSVDVDGHTADAGIEMVNLGSGHAIGIYGNNAQILNGGSIIIHNLSTGSATGIFADGKSMVTNSGTITINKETYTTPDGTEYKATANPGGQAVGIYGSANSTISNSGTIEISGAADGKGYGIYTNGGTVNNAGGKIIIGSLACEGEACFNNADMPTAIVLNGGILQQDGTIIASSSANSNAPASLNLDAFGGTVVASNSSKFIADGGSVSGTVEMSPSVVAAGFGQIYRVDDMITAADTANLQLTSQSALFTAGLENGSDAVLQMKPFAAAITDSSLADFLQQNYAAQNNEALFNSLKKEQTLSALRSSADSLSGKGAFSRFMSDDMQAWRELGFEISRNLQAKDLSAENKKTFSFKGELSPTKIGDAASQSRYSFSGVNKGNFSFGVGTALSDSHTGKSWRTGNKHDRNFQLFVPLGYRTHGFKLLSAPRLGYSYGTYEREGLQGKSYAGRLEKRLLGLNSEARYPLSFGAWTIAPTAEFNLMGYRLKGREDAKQFSLNIKSQDVYSVEAGFGIYADRELALSKTDKLKLSTGAAVYHEFANPYDVELQMNEMSGSWKLANENTRRERAVLRTGLNYEHGSFSLFGNIATYIDNACNANVDFGIKYNF